MADLIVNPITSVVTMTSLELVQFINNQRDVGAAELMHSDFLKKVPQVLGIGAGNFSSAYLDSQNKSRPCYTFPKREACLMAMSYSYDLQAKVFDRMTELEAKPAFTLPDFTNPAIAARAWADAMEAAQIITIERDHAIATKAQIGTRREATAMATASAAKKETAKLKDQLGFNSAYATVTAVQNATGEKFDWLPMRRWCFAANVPPKDVQDQRFGKVKAWPRGAWAECHGVYLVDLFGEVTA